MKPDRLPCGSGQRAVSQQLICGPGSEGKTLAYRESNYSNQRPITAILKPQKKWRKFWKLLICLELSIRYNKRTPLSLSKFHILVWACIYPCQETTSTYQLPIHLEEV